MIPDQALHPEDDREPLAPRDRRNGMQHARRVKKETPSVELHEPVAPIPHDAELAPVVVLGRRDEQRGGEVCPNLSTVRSNHERTVEVRTVTHAHPITI